MSATIGSMQFWAERKQVETQKEWLDAVRKVVEAAGGEVVVDPENNLLDIDTGGDTDTDMRICKLIMDLAEQMGVEIC